jgi:ATP-dependent helicase/DNAse subunit B
LEFLLGSVFMSVDLIIAPPAAGKTDVCIRTILERQVEQPLAQVSVVLPDRLQVSAFRQRLAFAGGALGVAIGTFPDLYRKLLEQAGKFTPVVPGPLLHRLVQETVDRAAGLGELGHFATIQGKPGFLQVLGEAFAELKRARVLPGQFLDFTRAGAASQREIAGLYERYDARLRELKWVDPEGVSWLALEVLEQQPELGGSIRLLVVDGFDAFTGAQRRVMELLAAQVGELIVTLPGSPDSGRAAEHRFVGEIEALRQCLAPRIRSLSGLPHLPLEVLHLQQHLFESGSELQDRIPATFMLEARSQADEAREALRWLKKLIVRQDLALEECAIFTNNLETYQPLLRAAAEEFGMPVHFTRSDPLNQSAIMLALLNLLSLPVKNYKTRALFNSLRSPYFDSLLNGVEVDALEDWSRTKTILEGLEPWQEVLTDLIREEQPGSDLDMEEGVSKRQPVTYNPGLQRKLLDFLERLQIGLVQGTRSQTAWIGWLEDLLEGLRFYENASGERDVQACEALREAMRALVLSEVVIGIRQLDYAQFLADLLGSLDGVGLPDGLLPGQPALLVGRMSEARGVRYPAVALLGLSEGIFPQVENPDPFLDEGLRRALGLEPRLEREQAGLFYQALTRADQHLLLTRPTLSEDGEGWEASPFWLAAKSLCLPESHQRVRADEVRDLCDAGSSQELLFWAVRQEKLPARYEDLRGRWLDLRQARDVLCARRAVRAGGRYEGSAASAAEQLGQQFPLELVWSASRLETYGTCPHMFYVSRVLDLEARGAPELGLTAAQIGHILHEILEDVYQAAENPGDVHSVLEQLPQVSQRVFAIAPQKEGFKPSALWEVEQVHFQQVLADTITALADEGSDWRPQYYEKGFGMRENPALEIDLGDEVLRLKGLIDRIDVNSKGELRVLDYKTGGSHLAQSDLKDGRRLQLPLYALAARDVLRLGTPVDGIYWEINAARSGGLKLAKFRTEAGQGPEAAYSVVIEHLRRILTGIRAADFAPIAPKGGCPSYCPAAQWCWRFAEGW